ncbi:MAG: hypothetical protein J6I84_03135 [Bacilli bacterium]|nr:hypothetical protein [Bacilli bacterium]
MKSLIILHPSERIDLDYWIEYLRLGNTGIRTYQGGYLLWWEEKESRVIDLLEHIEEIELIPLLPRIEPEGFTLVWDSGSYSWKLLRDELQC